jgi:hypothetical protein
VASLASHETRISALEGKSSRYAVTIPNSPTQEELTELYEDASGESGDPTTDGVRLVDVAKNIVYTWFSSDSTWHGPESDTVSPFTNTSSGIIKGSSGTAGKVYAESDGTGSVYGWDSMTSTVSGKQDALSFATTSAISNTSNALDVKVDGTTITKNASTGTLSASVSGGMTNPMQSSGDMIIGGTNGIPARLQGSSDGRILTIVSGLPTWISPALNYPGEQYIDLTLGSSGDTYTASADGWINLSANSSNSNGNYKVSVLDSDNDIIYSIVCLTYSSTKDIGMIFPIDSGRKFIVSYAGLTSTTRVFRFIYPKGTI